MKEVPLLNHLSTSYSSITHLQKTVTVSSRNCRQWVMLVIGARRHLTMHNHHIMIQYIIYIHIFFVRFMFCRRQCWWDQYERCLDAIYSKVKLRRRYWQEFVCMPFTDANFPCNYRKLSTAWRDWDMNRTLSNQ